jgi:putative Holliday junction resolvase
MGEGAGVRALGIDVGEQRIGVALSDPSGTLSTPHSMIRRTSKAAAEIAALARQVAAEVIVVGLPLKMRGGGEGTQAAAVRAFAANIARAASVPVEFYDERLTSVMAERSLIDSGLKRDKRKQQIDAVAAAIILQGWLDRRRLAAARAAERAGD